MAADVSIWVVEDDDEYRSTIAALLNQVSGMTCTRAFSSAETVLKDGMRASEVPDVVLMDHNLPGISGTECTARLKAAHPDVAVLMLTIRDDADTIFEALRAGASGYLLKNAPIDKIITAIREARDGGMLMPGTVARKVLGFFANADRPTSDYGLTDRERDVLQRMVEGLTQAETAAELFISPATVNNHVQRIYRKLHVNSGNAAVAKAVRERLV